MRMGCSHRVVQRWGSPAHVFNIFCTEGMFKSNGFVPDPFFKVVAWGGFLVQVGMLIGRQVGEQAGKLAGRRASWQQQLAGRRAGS